MSLNELVSAVRHFKPSTLVEHLAAYSVINQDISVTTVAWNGISPWALSEIAKFSAVYSNEHVRDRPFTELTLKRLCHLVHNAERFEGGGGPQEYAKRNLLRLGFEQFPYQRDLVGSAARAVAILWGTPRRHRELADYRDLSAIPFGIELPRATSAALLIGSACTLQGGAIFPGEFRQVALSKLFEVLPLEEFEHLTSLLTIPLASFRDQITTIERPDPETTRDMLNPLFKSPLLELYDGRLVAPELKNVLRSVGLDSVLSRTFDAMQSNFRRVGPVFQQYVTDLARQVASANCIPEIRYVCGQEPRDSIDIFLDLPEVLLLIEVKIRRPRGPLLTGSLDVNVAYEPDFSEATSQILQSVEDLPLIANINEGVTLGKSIIGIVITSERFHLSNSPLFFAEKRLGVPIVNISVDEFEQLVQLDGHHIGSRLLEVVNDPEKKQWDLSNSIPELQEIESRNPLIVEAWDAVTQMFEKNATG